jgi:hypothetical protein
MTTPAGQGLLLFVQARIGGEPLESTATSDMMLRTATKAAGAAGTLVDSPALGFDRAKTVTKTIRGAAVAVYLLSDTLGGTGLKRGLGLLVLALGGALVAISLLTAAAPAWLSTAGFGILLGGLAFAAMSTGMLTHALVMATPVLPLLVWAMTRPDDGDPSGTSRIVQIVAVAGIIATLLLLGYVRQPSGSPGTWLARVGTAAVKGAVVLGLVALLVVAVARTADWVTSRPGWAVAVSGGVLGLLLVASLWWISRIRGQGQPRRAEAMSWATAYGFVYTVLGLVLGALLSWGAVDVGEAESALGAVTVTLLLLALACYLLALTRGPVQEPAAAPDAH